MNAGVSRPGAETRRYRAFYDRCGPVEFEAVLPDDLDGSEDERQFLIDEAPFARQRAVRVEPVVLPRGVMPAATNTADPHPRTPEVAEAVRDALRADPIKTLARVLDPVAYDPRAVPANIGQGWDRKSRQMVAEVHATAAHAAGFRRVVEDDTTVERVARAIFSVREAMIDPSEVDRVWAETETVFRAEARAAVRALREETSWVLGDPVYANQAGQKQCEGCGTQWTDGPDACPECGKACDE